MGLDISAYSRLTKVINPGEDRDDLITLTDNPDFPGRIAPQTTGKYDCKDSADVFSMGYGSYNRWREWLAKLAGYPGVRNRWTPEPSHANGAFLQNHGPFWELINFSDCEGTIGTIACQKLLKDFNDWEERAQADSSSSEYDHYLNMQTGLKLAADGGALKFS
jgi:hypothetical protein